MPGEQKLQGASYKKYLKSFNEEFTQYIGIATDEPKRLAKLDGNKISLLEKYKYTEKMAYDLCKKYGLLSPVYGFSPRNGCWFCPNTKDCQLRYLRNKHRELWDKLLELEGMPGLIGKQWNGLTKTRIRDKEEQFMWEDRQIDIFDCGVGRLGEA